MQHSTPDYDVGRPFRSVTVARRLSVSPVDLGPHVRMEGHGVLALPASRPEARYTEARCRSKGRVGVWAGSEQRWRRAAAV